jgi:hypothetical protein
VGLNNTVRKNMTSKGTEKYYHSTFLNKLGTNRPYNTNDEVVILLT